MNNQPPLQGMKRLVEKLEAWNSFPWGEHLWSHLYDEIKNLKERHGDGHYYGLKKDHNYVPTYTLSSFVFAFQIKDPKVIPRAFGWSKKSLFTIFDYSYPFAKESRSTSDIRPTITEYESSWWILNNVYFQEHVPRALPIREQHSLFETYLSKLEKARKTRNTGFMVSSIGGTSDNSVRKKWLNDLVIIELNFYVFKLETIIQHDSDEDISQDILRVFHSMDTVWLSDDIELFLGQTGQVKRKFLWNDDYTVDKNF
nr:hypothetical protein [Tanacetum cinerariifolium]